MPLSLADKRPLIDWTLYEQTPGHWGAAMTVAAVTSVLRNAEAGWRTDFVDLLSELREGDPHAHAVLSKRYSAVSNADWSVAAAENDDQQEAADEIAEHVSRVISQIPAWKSHVNGLLWGDLTGASCREIMWTRAQDGWRVNELRLVHSRRIQYDTAFQAYITTGSYMTTGVVLRQYPGKFVLFESSVVDEHQTRQGIGRALAYWMSFKRFATRMLMAYTERFGNPFPVATWSTGGTDPRPRGATDDEIGYAKSLVKDIGRGLQPGAALPDAVKLDLVSHGGSSGMGGTDRTVHAALIGLCNSEISKACLGGTLTTEVTSTGSRAVATEQMADQQQIVSMLGAALDDVVTRDLVSWIVRLNYGEQWMHLCPRYCTHVEPADDNKLEADVLDVLMRNGLPVSVSQVREKFGWRAPSGDDDVMGKMPVTEYDRPVQTETGVEDDVDDDGTPSEELT